MLETCFSRGCCERRFPPIGAWLTFEIYLGAEEVELDEKLLRELSFQARGDLAPMAAFFGGCKLHLPTNNFNLIERTESPELIKSAEGVTLTLNSGCTGSFKVCLRKVSPDRAMALLRLSRVTAYFH